MPKTVREWTLIEEIGRGGMGVVWRATHRFLPGDWAVKAMRPELTDDEESRRRFISEVMVLTRLHHENIINVQTPFEEAGQLFLPMELLTGQSLEAALKTNPGPWPVQRVIDVATQAARGLAFAHSHNPPVIHRDIKPGNMQILTDGHVKVLDFGLARTIGENSMTATGKAVGTPAYMAPEVMGGNKATPRSDVYALGVVMYRMLAGRLPFVLPDEESSLVALVLAVVQAHQRGLPDVRDFAPGTPSGLADLTMLMLSNDPAQRPADAGEVVAILTGAAPLAGKAPDQGQATKPLESMDRTVMGFDLISRPERPTPPKGTPPVGPDVTRPPKRLRPVRIAVIAAGIAVAALLGVGIWKLVIDQPPADAAAAQVATADVIGDSAASNVPGGNHETGGQAATGTTPAGLNDATQTPATPESSVQAAAATAGTADQTGSSTTLAVAPGAAPSTPATATASATPAATGTAATTTVPAASTPDPATPSATTTPAARAATPADPAQNAPLPRIAGSWSGKITIVGRSAGIMTMSLKQNGASINGQFCLRQGSCTPVKGTVTAGRAVNLRGKLSDSAGGTFTFSLRLNQARNTLSGTGRFIVPSQQGRNRTDTLKAKVMVSRM